MDFSIGYHLLGKQDCPSCHHLSEKLRKLGLEFKEHDVVEEKIKGIRSVPQLIKNGNTVLIGDASMSTIIDILANN